MRTLVTALAFALLCVGVAVAAHKELSAYRCSKKGCGIVEEYEARGKKSCPECGSAMKYFMTRSVYGTPQSKAHAYRCTKCRMIHEYETRGDNKCPYDGHKMFYIQTYTVYE